MKATERIEYIDVAKGIGMLLVIMGHAFPAGRITKIIYSLHMPLFFILSGFTVNPDKYTDLKSGQEV